MVHCVVLVVAVLHLHLFTLFTCFLLRHVSHTEADERASYGDALSCFGSYGSAGLRQKTDSERADLQVQEWRMPTHRPLGVVRAAGDTSYAVAAGPPPPAR